MRYVLVAIDMQEDFFSHNPVLAQKRSRLTANINTLLGICRAAHVPVVWVTQEYKEDLSDAFLVVRERKIRRNIEGTEGCKILHELDVSDEELRIVKKRYSAFFNTNLDDMLQSLEIDTLILAGINTHACIRMAAVDAYQRDYNVILAGDCIDSYDEGFHRESLRYLTGYIAKALGNEEIRKAFN